MNPEADRLWARFQSEDAEAFLAAEVGINHNGSLELALACIDAAAEAGADGVKFQNYDPADFLLDDEIPITYESKGRSITESQGALFRRCALEPEHLEVLAARCRERHLVFFSTPTSFAGVQALVRAGAPLLKNGSDFLGHLPLIQDFAHTGLPTILSTGMATEGEVDDAVRAFREAGGERLMLLQCTSSYPAPPQDLNLRAMHGLRARYGVPVGFSDHSEGPRAAVLAVAMGACFIEKHFTLSRDLDGPDHRFSSDPDEFRTLVNEVRDAERRMGQQLKRPASSEALGRAAYRLSLVARDDLKVGTVLQATDLACRRPGTGLAPVELKRVLGLTLQQALRRGEPLTEAHLLAPSERPTPRSQHV